MAATNQGDPRSPRVRSALEWMRVVAAALCLGLMAVLVLDRRSGGFEYVVLLLGASGAFLGLDVLTRLIRRP